MGIVNSRCDAGMPGSWLWDTSTGLWKNKGLLDVGVDKPTHLGEEF